APTEVRPLRTEGRPGPRAFPVRSSPGACTAGIPAGSASATGTGVGRPAGPRALPGIGVARRITRGAAAPGKRRPYPAPRVSGRGARSPTYMYRPQAGERPTRKPATAAASPTPGSADTPDGRQP